MTRPFDTTPAIFERVLVGRELADGGDFAAAEQHFLGLLAEVRGGHPGDEARVFNSLITLYGRAGRYFEAHLLGRHVAAMARRAGPEADEVLAFALGAICGSLSKLHLSEPLERSLRELRGVLDRHPHPLPGLELEYHSAAASCAVERKDLPLARHHVTSYRTKLEGAEPLPPLFRWALMMKEVRLAFLEGHAELASRLMRRVRESGTTPAHHRLGELPLEVAIHVALGHREEALRFAGEAIGILEALESGPFAVSGGIHLAAELVRALEALEAWELVDRANDLVAGAVMIRLRQVDECTRHLPELGLDDAESTEILAAFRKQFLREQRVLLKRVASRVESRDGDPIRALLAATSASDHIAVCAWCESVRPSHGRWLPLGHFIPREGSLRVTHGICPTCAVRWTAESA